MENPRVKLKVVKKKNPFSLQDPERYYVQAVKTANVNLDWLARIISSQSTVSKADCLAVLTACVEAMIEELSRGSVVSLGALGSFQVGVRSEPSDTENKVTVSNIKSTHLNFRPSSELKTALKTMKFTISDSE
jgi:predicted histone-like DNA-binding protein